MSKAVAWIESKAKKSNEWTEEDGTKVEVFTFRGRIPFRMVKEIEKASISTSSGHKETRHTIRMDDNEAVVIGFGNYVSNNTQCHYQKMVYTRAA